MGIKNLIDSVVDEKDRKSLLKEWNDLWERIEWLDAMEQAGVDNWDGMDEARGIFNSTLDKKE
jgi:hypothetical protein